MLTKLFQSVENVKIMAVENHAMLFVYKRGSATHFINIFNPFASSTARGAGTCLIRRICENPASGCLFPSTFLRLKQCPSRICDNESMLCFLKAYPIGRDDPNLSLPTCP